MTPTVQAIAWTLIHFCWQAAAIAAAYRVVSLLTARRSSNTRYLVALSAMLLMVACAAVTFAIEITASAPIAAQAATPAPYRYTPLQTPVPAAARRIAAVPAHAPVLSVPALPLSIVRLVDGLWLLGVLALSLRSLGGWWLIHRLRVSATVDAPPALQASFRAISRALAIHHPALLRISETISGPMTVGALRALVLLPLSAVTSLGPDELEVVLAHELAHVRRADFFWNLVQTLVETLFFFHPAVWWIGASIRHERELCCDDLALTVCPNPVTYANALFELEQQRSRHCQLAMALDGHQPARTLRMRIARVLGEPLPSVANRSPFSLAAAAAGLVVLLLSGTQLLASLNPPPSHALAQSPMQAETTAPSIAPPPVSVPAPPVPVPEAPVIAPPAPPVSALAEVSAPQQNEAGAGGEKGNYIDTMKSAGYDVDLDKLIAMKMQGITPDYARSMSQLGFGKLSADDLVACKVQGVTPEYIASLKQGGIEVKSVSDAISYHIFSVTPQYIASMKAAGFGDLPAGKALALRVQGVTPEYARTIAQTYPGATADDVLKARIFNIDDKFIALAKKHGFSNLSFDKLVQLRISGVLDDNESK